MLPSDGAADWSLLSTITVEHVVPASVGQLVETAGEWYNEQSRSSIRVFGANSHLVQKRLKVDVALIFNKKR